MCRIHSPEEKISDVAGISLPMYRDGSHAIRMGSESELIFSVVGVGAQESLKCCPHNHINPNRFLITPEAALRTSDRTTSTHDKCYCRTPSSLAALGSVTTQLCLAAADINCPVSNYFDNQAGFCRAVFAINMIHSASLPVFLGAGPLRSACSVSQSSVLLWVSFYGSAIRARGANFEPPPARGSADLTADM